MRLSEECPCGGVAQAKPWGACCSRFVIDGQQPTTAEELMRSRYSAFAVKNADHLWRTWHPSTRPAQVGDLGGMTWTDLKILAITGGGPDDDAGTVDFIASFDADGHRGDVKEHSRFTKRAGRWFYVDGDELA